MIFEWFHNLPYFHKILYKFFNDGGGEGYMTVFLRRDSTLELFVIKVLKFDEGSIIFILQLTVLCSYKIY